MLSLSSHSLCVVSVCVCVYVSVCVALPLLLCFPLWCSFVLVVEVLLLFPACAKRRKGV